MAVAEPEQTQNRGVASLRLALGPGAEHAGHGIGRTRKRGGEQADGRDAIGGVGVLLEVEGPGNVETGHERFLLDAPGWRLADQKQQQKLLRSCRLIGSRRGAVDPEQHGSRLPLML